MKVSMVRKISCDEKVRPEPHHFLLEQHLNRTSEGTCKKCGWTGEELGRTFINYEDYGTPRMINGKSIIVKGISVKGSKQSPWRHGIA
mgnify:CR=1 FL=1